MQDHFKEKAHLWDSADVRVHGAKVIADAIEKKVELDKAMELIDFGVGTGLLGFHIAPKVKQIHGVDTSENMLKKLEEKNSPQLFIKPYCQDILKEPLEQKFDGLISSMTLHHVEDLELFFTTIYNTLSKDAFIAIADLELEDGTFHSNNDGVYHFGFDQEELSQIVAKSGFTNITFETINTINKPHKDFGIFLLTAYKE